MEELSVIFTSPKGNTSQHSIYCKRHSVRQPSAKIPNDRTLFTSSWPPYCGRDEIKELFTRVGQIEEVYLQEDPSGTGGITGRFAVGYIVFQEEDEVTRALSLCSGGVPLSCCIERVGLSKWCMEYQERYPLESTLEREAKEGVAAYDEWVEREAKRKKRLSEPDEEGWITVTNKTPLIDKGKKRKRKKKKELSLKLYHFQQRESQREKIAELRKKFQEDKEIIAAMKAKRKFQPF